MTPSYTLGIEFSTQSVKAVVLDLNDGNVLLYDSFSYDNEFPQYGTEGGVLPSDSPETRHTSPFMLIEAIDLVFDKLKKSGLNMSGIKAVKADGMQHCTVCANALFKERIKRPDPGQNLVPQISPCISRPTSPIWEDRSTSKEVSALNSLLEPYGGISVITGNRPELRFPASQIMKWALEKPVEYERTFHIFLLSAFVTSVLTGKICSVDTGDGWGTNLNSLDIDNPGWSDKIISTIDRYLFERGIRSGLFSRIGQMGHYDSPAGKISPYFFKKYGVNPDAAVLTGTGDNPATLLGCGGNIVISLGSSYTVNGLMEVITPSANGEYNVFGYTKGKAMALSVITNGGKVQDFFLKKYSNGSDSANSQHLSWLSFTNKAGDLSLTPDEKLLLPYLFEESVPLRKKGIIRDNFSEDNAEENIRALILSQVLSLRLHSVHLNDVKEICVVGGGAGNSVMVQWIADAFSAAAFSIENPSIAAPLGCALSGAAIFQGISYGEAFKRYIKTDPLSVKKPLSENIEIIKYLLERYRKLEKRYL